MVAAGHEDNFVPWNSKKLGILQEYTTDEFLGIQAVCIHGRYLNFFFFKFFF